MTASWRASGFEYDENVQNYIYDLIGSYYALLTADADIISVKSLLEVAKTAKTRQMTSTGLVLLRMRMF